MKGLLLKDLCLMKGQKQFFLILFAAAAGITAFSDDASFISGFLPFVLSMFTLSTISYDEFDNGSAFLFTLPISRTGYAVEKYCLALLLGGGAWILAALLAIVSGMLRRNVPASEIILTAVLLLPALLIVQAFMIPFQLRFGSEKGRIAMIGAMILLFAIGGGAVKAAQLLGIDPTQISHHLQMAGLGVMILLLFLAAIILFLISIKISSSIMKRKEF